MAFFKSLPDNAGPANVFTAYPEIYSLWSRMSQALMNGPSPLSQAERELFLAYAAGVAGCKFVYVAHSEAAYAWGIENGVIDRLLEDPDTAPIEARLRPLLAYVRKLMVTPAEMCQADADAVFAAGWNEQALHDAVAVTARAAFMQRLVEGHGFTSMARSVAAKQASVGWNSAMSISILRSGTRARNPPTAVQFGERNQAMKIVRVSAIPMSAPVPMQNRHRTDLGTKVKSDATLIRVETDNGLTGIGAALGTPPIVAAIVEHELAPECLGEDPMFSERIYEKMYNGSRSKPALERGVTQADESRRRGVIMEAIAGVDIAVWDAKAQALGIPLYQALGAVRSSVRGYASGGWAPGDEAEAELGGYAAKGFSAVKMRVVGRDGFSIANCVRRVKAARRGIGPDVELMVDAHGSLEVATAIKLARELEPYDIAWFEEPVSPDDHAGQAEVRRSTIIPIASGEREFTRFDFADLLERRALDIAQPDVARAGGLTEIRRIAALTSAYGVRLAPHAWGSGVLFAASIHVAMAAANCHILEVTQGYMPMMWDLFEQPFDIRPDGMVHAPDRPGLGFTLRKDALERFRYVDGPEYEF